MIRLRHYAAIILSTIGMSAGLLTPIAQAEPTFPAECPPTITCTVVPAPYVANDGNIEDYGNFDKMNRPSDLKINSIIIHDTEGSYEDTLKKFLDPRSYTSVQYVVKPDGTIVQMVKNKDVAWHAGNWWYNSHSIGIEHIGKAADGRTFTWPMYLSSAKLVKFLAGKYNIPLDRAHILGHDNVPAVRAADIAGMHVDPGPFFNWAAYMALIGMPLRVGASSNFVTIAPTWPLSKEEVTGCFPDTQNCVPAGPSQPTNFVYLRTGPDKNAPLVTDPVLGQGTTAIGNNAARLFYGQTLATAGSPKIDQGGIWYQVWANGVRGWFYSPWNAPTGLPASGKSITPKPGLSSVPVYGQPVPDRDEFPADVMTPPSPGSFWIKPATPLPYMVGAGQRYTVVDERPPNEYFYAWSFTANKKLFPRDHDVLPGEKHYYMIQFGSRVLFVNAADVVCQGCSMSKL